MHARSAMGVACLTVLLCAGTASSAPGDNVHIDGKAVITKDDRVLASGTYQCTRNTTPEPVMVTATVRQGDKSVSGGSQQAICDGRTHSWSVESSEFGNGRLIPGRATVESTLMQLELRDGLIPLMPAFLTAAEREVVLTEE
ncbi:DUF6299 family protein [Streptomyces sp. NPDC002851]